MLETIITIILVPVALVSVIFTGALIVGTVKCLADKKKN
jgi:hypothetical protein